MSLSAITKVATHVISAHIDKHTLSICRISQEICQGFHSEILIPKKDTRAYFRGCFILVYQK